MSGEFTLGRLRNVEARSAHGRRDDAGGGDCEQTYTMREAVIRIEDSRGRPFDLLVHAAELPELIARLQRVADEFTAAETPTMTLVSPSA